MFPLESRKYSENSHREKSAEKEGKVENNHQEKVDSKMKGQCRMFAVTASHRCSSLECCFKVMVLCPSRVVG